MNDIVQNKLAGMQRCVKRAREEYALAGDSFATNFSHQDAAILNITRACELALDLANYTIKTRKMGLPRESKESFELLFRGGAISNELCQSLKNMIGFRNLAIHEYRDLDIDIVVSVIEKDLDDILRFTDAMGALFGGGAS